MTKEPKQVFIKIESLEEMYYLLLQIIHKSIELFQKVFGLRPIKKVLKMGVAYVYKIIEFC